MTRAPIAIPEEALMEFAVIVLLITTTVAFVAYIWTWIAARTQHHEGEADEPSCQSTSDLGTRRDDRAHESARERAAVGGRSNGRASEGAGSLRG